MFEVFLKSILALELAVSYLKSEKVESVHSCWFTAQNGTHTIDIHPAFNNREWLGYFIANEQI